MKIPSLSTNYIDRSLGWSALLHVLLAVACFALLPGARAVNPPPDGGYPGFNTAEGEDALFNLDTTQSNHNTAIGFQALWSSNINAYTNTAIGSGALFSNTTGSGNTATGAFALVDNTTGGENTASGANSLNLNNTGSLNTANGALALHDNTSGSRNTAVGTVR